MVMVRVRLISWVVFLSLIVLLSAKIFSLPTSHFTTKNMSFIEKHSAHDPAVVRVVRVGTGEKARKVLSLITTCASSLCPRVSLVPPLIERAETAVPRSPALPVHQRISVYRI